MERMAYLRFSTLAFSTLTLVSFAACGGSISPAQSDASLEDASPAPSPTNPVPSPDAARDALADALADASPDVEDAGPPVQPFDWNVIVGTGQSLSVGSAGAPVISTTPSFSNLKLDDTGPDPRFSNSTNLVLVPLAEPIRPLTFPASYPAGVYPANIRGETPHTAMASQITALARAAGLADYVSLHSVVGSGGKSITFIRKGGTGNSYDRSLYEADAFKGFARTANKRLGFGAVILTHGEADAILPSYEADLITLAENYQLDLRAISGQSRPVPLFVSQQHSIPRRGDAMPRSTSTQAAWSASTKRPELLSCLGPKYQYAYAPDRVHMDAFGYRRLGIKHGQAYAQQVIWGRRWRPLEPTATTRAGRIVRVAFHVPVPPLAWDTVLPAPHPEAGHPWSGGKGFELEDSAGPVPIAQVAIVGTSIEITMAEDPQGTGLVVRYAMTQDSTGPAGARAGEGDGRMGLLRDSDPLVGIDDQELDVEATQGSRTLTGDFSGHGRYELVVGAGLPLGTSIAVRTSASSVNLSSPYTGVTGTVKAHVHSNQHNYAVAFELPVP